MKLFLERNSLANIALLSLSVFLGLSISPFFFLIWPVALLADDVGYYMFGRSIFDPEIRIQRGYQFGSIFVSGQIGEGRDLGFNLYDGDLTKSYMKSQTDKWDFMLKELKLSAGDSLIDIGCGFGDWLNYARSKGIHVVGVNITPEQAAIAHKKNGLDIIVANWKEIPKNPALQEKLYGKFDAVTFMDTVEHYVPAKHRMNFAVQDQIYSEMFDMSSKLLKNNASPKRVFISCLHQKSKKLDSFKEGFVAYLLDKYHSGCYPYGDDGLTKNCSTHFKELSRYDKTEDYRLTSVLDRDHFGAPKIRWNLKRILHLPILFILDPHHIHKWVDIAVDGWMWWHFGEDAWNPNYGSEHQKQNRRATLWWLVLEKKTAQKS